MLRPCRSVLAAVVVLGAVALGACSGDARSSNDADDWRDDLGLPETTDFGVATSGESGWTEEPGAGLGDGQGSDGMAGAGPFAVIARGDDVAIVPTDGTRIDWAGIPNADHLYLTQLEPGIATFVGTRAAWHLTLATGELERVSFDHALPADTPVVANGVRLAVVTRDEDLDDESPAVPRTELIRLVDIVTGTEYDADDLFPTGDGEPVWIATRVAGGVGTSLRVEVPGSDRSAIIRLDAATPAPVELPPFDDGGLVYGPAGETLAVVSDGSLYIGESGGDLGEPIVSGATSVLGLTPIGAVVSFGDVDSAPVLVAPDGTTTDVPVALISSGNDGLLRGAGSPATWFAAVDSGVVALPELDGMDAFHISSDGWWFVADQVSATSTGSPVKVVDPRTLEVTDLAGSPPEVMAALRASFSVDGRRGVARFQVTDGWREMKSVVFSLTGGLVQWIDVRPGTTVSFSPDDEWMVGRSSEGWHMIALSDDLSPYYHDITLGPDEDEIRPLGWVDG